jgi:hypothetical protein
MSGNGGVGGAAAGQRREVGGGVARAPRVAIRGIIAVVLVAGCRENGRTRTFWNCSPPIKVATHQQGYFQKEQCLEVYQ